MANKYMVTPEGKTVQVAEEHLSQAAKRGLVPAVLMVTPDKNEVAVRESDVDQAKSKGLTFLEEPTEEPAERDRFSLPETPDSQKSSAVDLSEKVSGFPKRVAQEAKALGPSGFGRAAVSGVTLGTAPFLETVGSQIAAPFRGEEPVPVDKLKELLTQKRQPYTEAAEKAPFLYPAVETLASLPGQFALPGPKSIPGKIFKETVVEPGLAAGQAIAADADPALAASIAGLTGRALPLAGAAAAKGVEKVQKGINILTLPKNLAPLAQEGGEAARRLLVEEGAEFPEKVLAEAAEKMKGIREAGQLTESQAIESQLKTPLREQKFQQAQQKLDLMPQIAEKVAKRQEIQSQLNQLSTQSKIEKTQFGSETADLLRQKTELKKQARRVEEDLTKTTRNLLDAAKDIQKTSTEDAVSRINNLTPIIEDTKKTAHLMREERLASFDDSPPTISKKEFHDKVFHILDKRMSDPVELYVVRKLSETEKALKSATSQRESYEALLNLRRDLDSQNIFALTDTRPTAADRSVLKILRHDVRDLIRTDPTLAQADDMFHLATSAETVVKKAAQRRGLIPSGSSGVMAGHVPSTQALKHLETTQPGFVKQALERTGMAPEEDIAQIGRAAELSTLKGSDLTNRIQEMSTKAGEFSPTEQQAFKQIQDLQAKKDLSLAEQQQLQQGVQELEQKLQTRTFDQTPKLQEQARLQQERDRLAQEALKLRSEARAPGAKSSLDLKKRLAAKQIDPSQLPPEQQALYKAYQEDIASEQAGLTATRSKSSMLDRAEKALVTLGDRATPDETKLLHDIQKLKSANVDWEKVVESGSVQNVPRPLQRLASSTLGRVAAIVTGGVLGGPAGAIAGEVARGAVATTSRLKPVEALRSQGWWNKWANKLAGKYPAHFLTRLSFALKRGVTPTVLRGMAEKEGVDYSQLLKDIDSAKEEHEKDEQDQKGF